MEQITMVPVTDLHPHEKNPRIDAAAVEDLAASIREHGIEIPLVAVPAATGGGYTVVGGHRRLTAAIEVGLTEVPVQIRPDLTDARDQIAFMATENLHRDQLTAREETRLVQDLLDLGWSQAEIARQTALGKRRVRDRVKLSKLTETTGEKLHRGQISVDDALVLAEFSDDPDSVTELEQSIGSYHFDYAVSNAKRRREDRDRAAASRKRAKKDGIRLANTVTPIVLLSASGRWATPALEARAGEDIDDDAWTDLLIAEHSTCPGHSAAVLTEPVYIGELGGRLPRGTLVIGCDEADTLHPDDAQEQPEAESEPDPWDDLSADEFATARVHRERHLAEHLPTADLATEARTIAVNAALRMGWKPYGPHQEGINFLQAITGAKGKAQVSKVLAAWPLPVLIWLGHHDYELPSHHRFMGEGKEGSTYWAPRSPLRQLLERTGYAWTEVEKQAILLATGTAHEATPADEDDAALAEGGDAA